MLRQEFKTRREAETALAAAQQSVEQGSVVATSTIKVGALLDEWLVSQQGRLKASTHHSYVITSKRIRSDLGHVHVQSLTPMQIESFDSDLLDHGRADGTGLSPKTVRNTHTVLRKALSDAQRLGAWCTAMRLMLLVARRSSGQSSGCGPRTSCVLQTVTPLQIEKFYVDLLDHGGRDGAALAPKTVKNTHVVLRKALADAERLGVVHRNAAAAARGPTVARPEMSTWSSDRPSGFGGVTSTSTRRRSRSSRRCRPSTARSWSVNVGESSDRVRPRHVTPGISRDAGATVESMVFD